MLVHFLTRTAGGLVGVLACFAFAVPVAEASFPGSNGLIAFTREGPPFDNTPPVVGAETIWAIDPRDGRARQLTHVSRRCGRAGWSWWDSQPSFSASGRTVVYVHEDFCDPRTFDGIYA